jgi:hypothetical protein
MTKRILTKDLTLLLRKLTKIQKVMQFLFKAPSEKQESKIRTDSNQ